MKKKYVPDKYKYTLLKEFNSITDYSLNFKELKSCIVEKIGPNFSEEDIIFEFLIEQEPTYYDDIIVSGKMSVFLREKVTCNK